MKNLLHVIFDKSNSFTSMHIHDHEDVVAEAPKIDQNPKSDALEKTDDKSKNQTIDVQRDWRILRDHPKDHILGKITDLVSSRSSLCNTCASFAFLCPINPKSFKEVEVDEIWILAMQEELNKSERNKVWILVSWPNDHLVIGTRLIYRNKLDETDITFRNKVRLVA